jgi:CNT family concentrative nucleoside transporter
MKRKTIISSLAILILFLVCSPLAGQSEQTGPIVESGFSLISFLRGLLGIAVLLGLGFLFSSNRRSVQWRIILFGLIIQVGIALLVLKVPLVQSFFEFIGKVFMKILQSSNAGSEFLFKSIVTGDVEDSMINFAFHILPTIIFFSALTSVLFYYGVIQKIVYALAWLLKRFLKISGAESLSATGNIFLGQTESPFLIKEYLPKMNKSEMMLVMVGGMATIAGGVLAIYIGLLGGTDPQGQLLFAKHLITASVMAAPGGVVMAKLLVPQTETVQSDIEITRDKVGSNILEAISNGTGQGIRLAVNVAAMLVVFLAFIYFLNQILLVIGDWTTINAWITGFTGGQYTSLSLEFMLGMIFSPLAWLLGVPAADMSLVAQLFGEKIILNEMVAYISMKDLLEASSFTHQKSIIMATYILCGFANFASVGIQVGGIGAIAPNQKKLLGRLGFKALVGGAMASLLSATIVGMILG